MSKSISSSMPAEHRATPAPLARFCALGVATAVFFQLAPASSAGEEWSLTSLKARYQEALTGLERQYAGKGPELLASYGKVLENIETAARRKGDLDALLAVKNEKERFRKEKNVPSTSPEDLHPDIATLQARYHEALNKSELDKQKGVLALTEQYKAQLKVLEQRLTKLGRIEDALAVRQERETASARPEAKAAEFIVADAAMRETTGPGTDDTASAPGSAAAISVAGAGVTGLFKGKVEEFDPATLRIVIFYDFESPEQIQDWESLLRRDYGEIKASQPWTDNVLTGDTKLKGKLRKATFSPLMMNTKAAFTGDIEVSFDIDNQLEGRQGGHAGLMYKTGPGSGTWSEIVLILPGSQGYEFKDKGGIIILDKPIDDLRTVGKLPASLVEAAGPQAGSTGRHLLRVQGRKLSYSIDGKAIVENWTPQGDDAERIFPDQRAEHRVAVFLHIHRRPIDVAFDNIRIRGTLSREWLSKQTK